VFPQVIVWKKWLGSEEVIEASVGKLLGVFQQRKSRRVMRVRNLRQVMREEGGRKVVYTSNRQIQDLPGWIGNPWFARGALSDAAKKGCGYRETGQLGKGLKKPGRHSRKDALFSKVDKLVR